MRNKIKIEFKNKYRKLSMSIFEDFHYAFYKNFRKAKFKFASENMIIW